MPRHQPRLPRIFLLLLLAWISRAFLRVVAVDAEMERLAAGSPAAAAVDAVAVAAVLAVDRRFHLELRSRLRFAQR